jgi:hypothetical protein
MGFRGRWTTERSRRPATLHLRERLFESALLAVLLQAFDVKRDRTMNQLDDLGAGLRDGHAAGQIRDVCAEAASASLNHHCVSH